MNKRVSGKKDPYFRCLLLAGTSVAFSKGQQSATTLGPFFSGGYGFLNGVGQRKGNPSHSWLLTPLPKVKLTLCGSNGKPSLLPTSSSPKISLPNGQNALFAGRGKPKPDPPPPAFFWGRPTPSPGAPTPPAEVDFCRGAEAMVAVVGHGGQAGGVLIQAPAPSRRGPVEAAGAVDLPPQQVPVVVHRQSPASKN